MTKPRVKLVRRVTFCASPRFPTLYDQAAERLGMTTSEWLRSAAAKQLLSQGYDLAAGPANTNDMVAV